MSSAARSLFAFGVYIFLTGIVFLAVPGLVMSLLHLPPAPAGWVRMIGVLALVIGAYDVTAARANCVPYIQASVWVRFGFAAGMVLLFVTGQMPVSVLLFGGLDVVGAVWTWVVLARPG